MYISANTFQYKNPASRKNGLKTTLKRCFSCLIRHSLGQQECVGLRRIPDYRVKFPLYDARWDRKFVSD